MMFMLPAHFYSFSTCGTVNDNGVGMSGHSETVVCSLANRGRKCGMLHKRIWTKCL